MIDTRRAGVLLHPTSLTNGRDGGDLGPTAYRFVDFLAACGLTVWQTLPLGPTHDDGSPYQCLSVYAGNPMLISLEHLSAWGWLNPTELGASTSSPQDHQRALARAAAYFFSHASAADHAAYADFIAAQASWLDDYALYQALHVAYEHRSWLHWPPPLRCRDPQALALARQTSTRGVDQARFEQYVFFRQWFDLKRYANQRGVLLFGDMPIFVAHDSADVWAHPECFLLNDDGHAQVVAGVPPDYFSADGQLWGNPLYRWDHMMADDFRWWVARVAHQLALFDVVRIDHFRGFEASWTIPAGARTAAQGQWVQVPGEALFQTLRAHFPSLPLVAEDLGVITPAVEALRDRYGLPGMKILQFAFDGGPHNPYLCHNHVVNGVVYTGTHDNDTTLGWYAARSPAAQAYVNDYLADPSPMPWPMIRAAFRSVARVAIVPMQDLLALDSTHRMNCPGTTTGNWRWRFTWEQVPEDLASRVRRMVQIYGRGG